MSTSRATPKIQHHPSKSRSNGLLRGPAKGCYFSKITDAYLHDWLAPTSWDADHPLDVHRFYRFVRALYHYCCSYRKIDECGRTLIKSREVAERIELCVKEHHPNRMGFRRQARQYADRVEELFDFLYATDGLRLKLDAPHPGI